MQLIVCESSLDWATWLKRELAGEAQVVETRRLDEIWPLLARRAPTIVALELTAGGIEASLAAFVRIDRTYPEAVAVALATRRLSALEPAAREAGAALFLASTRKFQKLTNLARHWAANATADRADVDKDTSIEDRVFASLPWGG